MKNSFVILKGGAVIYCTSVNTKTGYVYGYNFASPYLREKSYKITNVDRVFNKPWKEDLYEVKKALKIHTFYWLQEDNKYHSAKITKQRYDLIVFCATFDDY